MPCKPQKRVVDVHNAMMVYPKPKPMRPAHTYSDMCGYLINKDTPFPGGFITPLLLLLLSSFLMRIGSSLSLGAPISHYFVVVASASAEAHQHPHRGMVGGQHRLRERRGER